MTTRTSREVQVQNESRRRRNQSLRGSVRLEGGAKNGICLRSENAADAPVVDLTIGRGLARRADRTGRLDHTVRQPRRIGADCVGPDVTERLLGPSHRQQIDPGATRAARHDTQSAGRRCWVSQHATITARGGDTTTPSQMSPPAAHPLRAFDAVGETESGSGRGNCKVNLDDRTSSRPRLRTPASAGHSAQSSTGRDKRSRESVLSG